MRKPNPEKSNKLSQVTQTAKAGPGTGHLDSQPALLAPQILVLVIKVTQAAPGNQSGSLLTNDR